MVVPADCFIMKRAGSWSNGMQLKKLFLAESPPRSSTTRHRRVTEKTKELIKAIKASENDEYSHAHNQTASLSGGATDANHSLDVGSHQSSDDSISEELGSSVLGLKVKSTKHMMRVERQRSQQRRKAHEGTGEVAPLHSKKLKTRQSASSGSSTAGSSEDILAAVDSDLHSSALMPRSSRGPSVDADVRYSVFSSSKAASSSMSQGHPFARSSAGGSLPLMRHSPKSAGLPEPLIKLIVHIHETTRENHKLLKSLLEVIEKKPFDFGSHTEPPFSCPQLPVLDEEGLEKLELCLSDQDDREQMKRLLSALGGRSPREITGRLLQGLMADDLAVQFNFEGRGSKHAFRDLCTFEVLIDVGMKHGVTKAEMERAIKSWLRHAPERASRAGQKHLECKLNGSGSQDKEEEEEEAYRMSCHWHAKEFSSAEDKKLALDAIIGDEHNLDEVSATEREDQDPLWKHHKGWRNKVEVHGNIHRMYNLKHT
ncbi:unnamed protein product [Darwinula stevensoni]|uniref:DUF4806 domain-containing protein n=1 Tax=Darwinula stevensoni TaxID=69355 RepID=A0A7R9AE73_9CRUS|nr:unnamed protein product [Darwinula stevensoni]CAG0902088.1 unnamed protein product [Darwinula stevensoni]